MEQEGPPEDPEDLLAWLAADESQRVSEGSGVEGLAGTRKDAGRSDLIGDLACQLDAVWASTRPPQAEDFTEQDFHPNLHYLSSEPAAEACTGDAGEHYSDLFREMLVEPSLLACMTGLSVDCSELGVERQHDGEACLLRLRGSQCHY